MGKQKSMLENENQKDLISQSTITNKVERISTRKKENMSTRSLDTLLELIEKGQQKDDINSISSEISSDQTDSNFQSLLMQKLHITDKDVEVAKRNKASFSDGKESIFGQSSQLNDRSECDENTAKIDDTSLTYDLGSNEIEEATTSMSYKSEMEDET